MNRVISEIEIVLIPVRWITTWCTMKKPYGVKRLVHLQSFGFVVDVKNNVLSEEEEEEEEEGL